MTGKVAVLALAALLGLAACGSDKPSEGEDKPVAEKKKPPICPQVAIIHDLDLLRDYGGDDADESRLVAAGRMLAVDGTCEYRDNGVDVTFDLTMAAMRGPSLGGSRVSLPYFVAVVAPDKTVLSKDSLNAAFAFASDKSVADRAEPIHVFIPLPKSQQQTGPLYQVLTGFQLTKEQVEGLARPEAKERSETVK